mmetsp:Transcript_32023/g.103612  ORF Transcript_32023/g.103612 Transcript_32023/m.103612 type:complete len:458 (-) Transcript_32023:567-1940(-)
MAATVHPSAVCASKSVARYASKPAASERGERERLALLLHVVLDDEPPQRVDVHLNRLHRLQLRKRRLAAQDDGLVGHVDDEPLRSAAQQARRLEDDREALALLEAARGLQRRVVGRALAHVPARREIPAVHERQEGHGVEQAVRVRRRPAAPLLEQLHDRDERPVVGKGDQLRREAILHELRGILGVAAVCVAPLQEGQLREARRGVVLLEEQALRRLEPPQLGQGLGLDDVPREEPVARVRPEGKQEGDACGEELPNSGDNDEAEQQDGGECGVDGAGRRQRELVHAKEVDGRPHAEDVPLLHAREGQVEEDEGVEAERQDDAEVARRAKRTQRPHADLGARAECARRPCEPRRPHVGGEAGVQRAEEGGHERRERRVAAHVDDGVLEPRPELGDAGARPQADLHDLQAKEPRVGEGEGKEHVAVVLGARALGDHKVERRHHGEKRERRQHLRGAD